MFFEARAVSTNNFEKYQSINQTKIINHEERSLLYRVIFSDILSDIPTCNKVNFPA